MTQYMQEAGAMKQADELMELARQYAHAYYNAYTGSHDGMLHKTREALRAALAAALPPAAVQAKPTPGYTREGFLRLLHEQLAAAHLAGRDNEGFPVSGLKLLMHYFDQLVPDEGTLTAGKQGGAPMDSEPTK